MAKAFSVASWNVEHFGATNKDSDVPKKPIAPIIKFLADQNADIVAVYEVVGKVVFSEVQKQMPNYQFVITEGPQSQEIMVGYKKSISAFFTQKVEFKSGAATLRPGALLTIAVDGQNYPLLFLHLKSLTEPKGFGLRDDMFSKAISLRKSVDKAHTSVGNSGRANFIYLGDINTMGMNLTYSKKDISAQEEIDRLASRMGTKSVEMRILEKSHGGTWWPGSSSSYPVGNLDHVVSAEHLKFKSFAGSSVDVRGWVDESTDAKKDGWVKKYSDHALLYFEVQKV